MEFTNLNTKSILLEIVNRDKPQEPVESFCLIIPPETLEIEEPQRVVRTKTWGGVFIDDYGPDVIKITIAGNTGSTTLRKTYCKDNSDDFDGRSAFFYLRDHIMRYKEKYSSDYEKYDIMYYDLSTAQYKWNRSGVRKIQYCESESYVVSLEKFKLTRNKDKPLFYNYSIEFVAIRALGTFTGGAVGPLSIQGPLSWIANLARAMNIIKSVFTTIKNIKDKAENWIDFIGSVTGMITSFVDQTLDIFTYPLGFVKMLLGATRDIISAIDDLSDSVLNLPFEIEEDALNIVEITKQIGTGACSLVTYGKTPGAVGGETIPVNEQPNRQDALVGRFSSLSDVDSQIIDKTLEISTGVGDTIKLYGYFTVIADTSTTLEGLAVEHYADASFAEIIAVANDIRDDAEIVIGSVIRIPVLLQSRAPENNYIYTDNLQDVYGADIRLGENGSLVIAASGDFSVIEGIDNLVQALNLRLNERLGARLRLTVYGLKVAIGSSSLSVPVSYIVINLKDTVMQDPRVSSISNIKIKGEGDRLYISFNVGTIKLNEIIPYSGSI